MKRLFFYLIVFLFISSCSENDFKETPSEELKSSDSVTTRDSSTVIQKLTLNPDTTPTLILPPPEVISEGSPTVTLLPFSVHGYYYINELVKNNPKVYRLPSIEKLEYFPIFGYCPEGDCVKDFNKPPRCSEGEPIDTSVFKFKKYRLRLPDIHHFQSYIVCDTLYWNYGIPLKYGTQFPKCDQVYFREHCYLVICDSVVKAAKVIALHHPTPSRIDNPQARTFTIDKNFVIHLQDYSIEYDEEGMGGDFAPLDFTYDIKVLSDGNLEVTKSNKQK